MASSHGMSACACQTGLSLVVGVGIPNIYRKSYVVAKMNFCVKCGRPIAKGVVCACFAIWAIAAPIVDIEQLPDPAPTEITVSIVGGSTGPSGFSVAVSNPTTGEVYYLPAQQGGKEHPAPPGPTGTGPVDSDAFARVFIAATGPTGSTGTAISGNLGSLAGPTGPAG